MESVTKKAPMRAREFPLASVRFLQVIGEGAFGKVYRGELTGYHSSSSVTRVAIKTLKEDAAPKVQNDFRREVELMSDLKHPNIVCLLGVSMRQQPLCMLFEYMALGDLHEYLIMHSPHSDVSGSDDDHSSHILSQSDMLHIAVQVAAGMEYLASHHYVHRDLAARNILMGENTSVKISDFGLSRDVYSSDYYRIQSKSLLPVRWMSPESILYGKFTIESDVWSYGVVLWEIFGFGLQPYYGYSNQEVVEMIRGRQILPAPEDCPARAYTLMVECWNETPYRRPNFTDIHTRLRQWQSEGAVMPRPGITFMYTNSYTSPPGYPQLGSTGSPGYQHNSSSGPSNTTATTGISCEDQQPIKMQTDSYALPSTQMHIKPTSQIPRKPSSSGSVSSHKSSSTAPSSAGSASSNPRSAMQNVGHRMANQQQYANPRFKCLPSDIKEDEIQALNSYNSNKGDSGYIPSV